jgi:hypothetical protein
MIAGVALANQIHYPPLLFLEYLGHECAMNIRGSELSGCDEVENATSTNQLITEVN